MLKEKDINITNLTYYHSDSIGFVFTGAVPSSHDALERMVNNLVSWKVSEKLPEFYVRVAPNSVAFVYAGDSGFQQAKFYQFCNRMNVMGIFEIDTLGAWLKSH